MTAAKQSLFLKDPQIKRVGRHERIHRFVMNQSESSLHGGVGRCFIAGRGSYDCCMGISSRPKVLANQAQRPNGHALATPFRKYAVRDGDLPITREQLPEVAKVNRTVREYVKQVERENVIPELARIFDPSPSEAEGEPKPRRTYRNSPPMKISTTDPEAAGILRSSCRIQNQLFQHLGVFNRTLW
ncbi:MAG TPA: hypothetical protein VGL97_14195 [Bryobacteraceae bacterium]